MLNGVRMRILEVLVNGGLDCAPRGVIFHEKRMLISLCIYGGCGRVEPPSNIHRHVVPGNEKLTRKLGVLVVPPNGGDARRNTVKVGCAGWLCVVIRATHV